MNFRGLILAACVAPACCAAGSAEGPRVVRENIEWLDVWVPDAGAHDLPRVLLVGDSITRGYGPDVERQLKGKAYVARLATSKSVGDPALLAEVALVLGQYHFDAIHFNNGMHGWGYTEEEYARAFPDLVDTLRKGAKGARLIWATTTPVREPNNLEQMSPRTERVRARNSAAAAVAARERIPVDDLFGLVKDHPEYYSKDGVRFNAQGVSAQAAQVAQQIMELAK
jgi:lysophospholipase L1-like esterase